MNDSGFIPSKGAARLIVTLTAACLAQALHADTIIVPDDTPFFGVALAQAASGDTIIVRAGTYAEANEFVIDGKTVTIMSESPEAEVILSGADLHRVLRIEGPGANGTVIDGITFRDGTAPGNGSGNEGGGLRITNADVTIRNCVFDGNTAVGAGGGLYISNTSLTIANTQFLGNSSTGSGADGGGAFLNGGIHTISGCLFEGNSAADSGGGFRLDAGAAQVTACVFTGNTVGVGGGAFFGRSGTGVTFDHCRFEGNHADLEGGGLRVYDAGTALLVRNSLFLGNTAAQTGGALHLSQATVKALNCTFMGNEAGSSNAIISYQTVGPRAFHSVIVWNNTPASTPFESGINLDVRYSLVEGGQPGLGNINADPMLDRDGRPLAGSPVIDAGSTSLYSGPFSDFGGGQRGLDDPDTADTGESIIGPVVDMGAYEYQPVPVSQCPGDINGDGMVDGADLGILLAAWGSCP